ncbi:MAG: hypothetical protein GY904_31890 [Planctomycetaceae bacterium]|nr:hypothetical protein [Planctomycetaceae bacterium]
MKGSSYAFGKTEKKPNAVDAHWVALLGDLADCQDALFTSFFKTTEPRAPTLIVVKIDRRQIRVELAIETELDWQTVGHMLNSEDRMAVPVKGRGLLQRHQIDTVPFFIMNVWNYPAATRNCPLPEHPISRLGALRGSGSLRQGRLGKIQTGRSTNSHAIELSTA